MHQQGITIYSTGGTWTFLKELGIPVIPVEEVTGYPGILGGRVKTLHPGIFGGILYRRNEDSDKAEVEKYKIPSIDLVMVDLYPFEETLASGASDQEIIEKIDIGGVSLIRAAAKNFSDVLIIPQREDYSLLEKVLDGEVENDLTLRRKQAGAAIGVTSRYDEQIAAYLSDEVVNKPSFSNAKTLRYGENPHQSGTFYGKLDELFEQLHGKELSYNNLLDVDAAVNLIDEFEDTAVAILKHNNPCGLAIGNTLEEAWRKALAGDPVSAFGGVIIMNKTLDKVTAEEINKIFCEVVIAPGFDSEALTILQQKKNRIILSRKESALPKKSFRSLLNGILEQDKDLKSENASDLKTVTEKEPTVQEISDMIFANRIVKHCRSNAIVLVREGQMIGSGVGQTSRVDALKQAVEKAKNFNFDLKGSVLASDAFFPFSDCVEIAASVDVSSVIQPGGSVKDQESIDAANRLGVAMVFTGSRHFRH